MIGCLPGSPFKPLSGVPGPPVLTQAYGARRATLESLFIHATARLQQDSVHSGLVGGEQQQPMGAEHTCIFCILDLKSGNALIVTDSLVPAGHGKNCNLLAIMQMWVDLFFILLLQRGNVAWFLIGTSVTVITITVNRNPVKLRKPFR